MRTHYGEIRKSNRDVETIARLAEKFIREYGRELRFVHRSLTWMWRDGMAWVPDNQLRAYSYAHRVCRHEGLTPCPRTNKTVVDMIAMVINDSRMTGVPR